MTANVLSPADVRFTFGARPERFCVLNASIVRVGESRAAWEIRRRNGLQAPCPDTLHFPLAPQGYAMLGSTRKLEPGRYQASADGGTAHASVDFIVP